MSKNPEGPRYRRGRGSYCNFTICRHRSRPCCWRDGKSYSGKLQPHFFTCSQHANGTHGFSDFWNGDPNVYSV